MPNKTDVIIVGGGPAGISAAITVARAGKNVVLIERGSFAGSKNMFGGAIYTKPTKEIFPDFEQDAPLERKIKTHKYILRNKSRELGIEYFDNDDDNAYSVIRGKFDRYMQKEAEKAGVVFVTETLVEDLLWENKTVVGVKTELEEYRSDIVILADGVNSILAKKSGLRKQINPKDVVLSVKEVLKFDKNVINERFNVTEDEGVAYQIFGEPMNKFFGAGFLYTNKDSVAIGVGVSLEDLADLKIKPYELLEQVKSHPRFKNLLKDGELIEYSAHLIPEGGYYRIPKMFGNGVLVTGDAAMLVNAIHFEGTNFAMISGKLAGETALKAIEKQDFSSKTLSLYEKNLKNSFIIKDLITYKDVIKIIAKHRKTFFDYYIAKVLEFFNIFTTADSVPKRTKYRKYVLSFFKDRPICTFFKEIFDIFRMVIGVFCGK